MGNVASDVANAMVAATEHNMATFDANQRPGQQQQVNDELQRAIEREMAMQGSGFNSSIVPMIASLIERKKMYKNVEDKLPVKSKNAFKQVNKLVEKIIKDVKEQQKSTGSGVCYTNHRRGLMDFRRVVPCGDGLPKSRKGNSNAKARGQMVSELMKSEGLTLGQASKKLASMNK